VSGKRPDHLEMEWDDFFQMEYCMSTRLGARSIMKSKVMGNAIRVFRSSVYKNRFGTLVPSPRSKRTRQMYRYDGLYSVVSIRYQDKESKQRIRIQHNIAEHSKQNHIPTDRKYIFTLKRNELSTIPDDKILAHCVAMKTINSNVLS
jgi:hypothetical protein